jgi:cyclohexanone monooxygenase
MAYVISETRRRGYRTIEPTAAAEEEWVQTIVALSELRRPFLEECTPGYYNNEGTPNPRMAQNASYGAGAVKFMQLMRDWRAAGKLEGLDLKPERQANL